MLADSLGIRTTAISASSREALATSSSLVDAPREPAVLQPRHVQQLLADFFAEYEPVGPTEVAMVRDLARQAAATERWGQTAEAAFRQGAVSISALLGGAQQSQDYSQDLDSMLAAAATSESTERSSRHHLGHARSFYRALEKLRELQAARKLAGPSSQSEPPEPFESEAACEAYLAERFRAGQRRCPRCEARSGYFLATRRVWECAKCQSQIGIRAGTVMTGSRLPLLTWFEAVRWLLWTPTMSAAQLANKLGIGRLPTVRKLACSIRAAMADENATEKLAGLDEHFQQQKLEPVSSAPFYKSPRAMQDVLNPAAFPVQPQVSQAITVVQHARG